MAVKFFGQFLLEKGHISREALLDAIDYQKTIVKPLVALAVEKGYLTTDQLSALDREHNGSDKKMLELAVKQGVLTLKQLETLSREQSARWIFLGEALVQRGHLSLVRLQELFQDYKKEQGPGSFEMQYRLENIPEKEVISALLKTTVDVFIHYTRQIVKVDSVEETRVKPDNLTYTFSQKVMGDKNFYYAVALPEPLVLSIASYMLTEEQLEVNAVVLDAVSEFVNVVAGNGCAKLSLQGVKTTAQPPQAMTPDMVKQMMAVEGPAVIVKLKTTKGDFQVVFAFVERT